MPRPCGPLYPDQAKGAQDDAKRITRLLRSESKLRSFYKNVMSDAIKLDVLSGVHGALEPLGHVAQAIPRVAGCIAEYRRAAM
jgi:hypothetical protein